jgi:hypothetical protein
VGSARRAPLGRASLSKFVHELAFGVLTSGERLAPWEAAVLRRLAAVAEVRADCWLPTVAPERADLRVLPGDSRSADEHRAWLARLPTIPIAGPQGLDAVRARDLDFILSFAPPSPSRALLPGARLGVWRFFFGDWARYQGESHGFWEIVDDAPVSSAILAQLQPDPRAVRVLKEGCVRTHRSSAAAHVRALQDRCVHWPAQVCLELLDGASDATAAPIVLALEGSRRRVRPTTRFAYAGRAGLRVIREQLGTLLRHEQWTVGLLDAPIETLLERRPLPEVRWLRRPRREEFFADPFGAMHDGRFAVLCERFDHRTARGTIVALTADDRAPIEPVRIGAPVHLSYPFVFEHERRLFCIPEMHEAGEVVLYEAERFPGAWRRVATLVEDALLDVTPFRHAGRWWLAASRPAARGANDELHLWHADALTGPWRPHAANPVKLDVRSARPAGTPFVKDGVLYRPAQDCSRGYGGRVVINRVVTLTPRSFREECVAAIEPPRRGRYREGLHTISSVGSMTLVDAKRTVFVPAAFWHTLGGVFRAAARRRWRTTRTSS